HASGFAVISKMARIVLAIQGAAVSVERIFSYACHICVDTRLLLKAESITELMCWIFVY
ncbi:uncharacterized protein STEHIDRAFT_58817, partial [Stereum hirsutum FP-91666 SS1]|uniref:uncharacterized protein n=1 Tax=Stereum hirsutum (strain FP-91666) TaxID=721885 RepID=UPI000444A923